MSGRLSTLNTSTRNNNKNNSVDSLLLLIHSALVGASTHQDNNNHKLPKRIQAVEVLLRVQQAVEGQQATNRLD
jgi:hypothetical protein